MKFGVENKKFQNDVVKMYAALRDGEKFAFSKYADGEFCILRNQPITNCDNWTFTPGVDQKYHDELMSSFKYSDPGYFVGISCPCCVGAEDTQWMRDNVGSAPENLTWANIFVNGNYQFFVERFIPEFRKHDVVLVANRDAHVERLPFRIEEFIPVTGTAWKDNYDLLTTLPEKNHKNKLFLFCAGPLGNMLAAKLWETNKNNTYLDIGSTLNPWLVGANRGYLRGAPTLQKICTW